MTVFEKKFIGNEFQIDNSSVVYWIRKSTDNDMFSQGYIGVSKRQVFNRWNQHIWDRRRGAKRLRPLSLLLLSKEKIIFQVISVHQSFDDALDMEIKLRPQPYIGLNVSAGGNVKDPTVGGKVIGHMKRQAKLDRWRKEILKDKTWLPPAIRFAQNKYEAQIKKDKIKMYQEIWPKYAHTKAHSTNTTKIKGVSWYKKYNKWRVQASFNSKNITIKYTDNKQQAIQIANKVYDIINKYRCGFVDCFEVIKVINECK